MSNGFDNIPLSVYTLFVTLETALFTILQWNFDIIGLITAYDFIGLSWIIMGIYLVVSAIIGYKYYLVAKSERVQTEFDWFNADSTTRWGMFGTIIGVMYVLTNAFPSITGDFTMDKEILITATEGIGTALITTGVGMVADYFLSIKLMTLDMFNEKLQKDE